MKPWLAAGVLVALITATGCVGAPKMPTRSETSQPTTGELPDDTTKHANIRNINGITFKEQVGASDLGCAVNLVNATPEEVDLSPLKFTAAYIPKGFVLKGTVASACQGRVVSLASLYDGPAGELNISRFAGRAAVTQTGSPQAVEVAGKRGVRIGSSRLIMVEEFGMTIIDVAADLDFGEIVKIAEGIK